VLSWGAWSPAQPDAWVQTRSAKSEAMFRASVGHTYMGIYFVGPAANAQLKRRVP
jgi:hypothetical protein